MILFKVSFWIQIPLSHDHKHHKSKTMPVQIFTLKKKSQTLGQLYHVIIPFRLSIGKEPCLTEDFYRGLFTNKYELVQNYFCKQMHCLLKHKMLQFVLKISLYMAPTCFGPSWTIIREHTMEPC